MMGGKGRLALMALGLVGVAVVVALLPATVAEKLVIAAVLALLIPGVAEGLFRALSWPFAHSHRVLQARGRSAEATVLEMWDTGLTINDNPRVGLRLEVRPAGDPPFEARTRMVVPRLMVGQIRPGSVLKVRYDPQNPQRVEWDTGAQAVVSPRALQRMAELEELWRQGLVTEEEYQRKRREILDGV